jgi:hypothetical protein
MEEKKGELLAKAMATAQAIEELKSLLTKAKQKMVMMATCQC